MTLPNLVINVLSTKCEATEGVLTRIVLNLKRLKSFLFLPTLFCTKKGLPDSKKQIKYIINNIGLKVKTSNSDIVKS